MPLLDTYLKETIDYNASDLHLCSHQTPAVRLYGKLIEMHKNILYARDVALILNEILTSAQKEELDRCKSIDFAYNFSDNGKTHRFRCHVMLQKYGFDGYFRLIPGVIKTMEQLYIPEQIKETAKLKQGLILVTGPVCSGKTTTIAAILDLINKHRSCHIVTIEDPVEYIHENKKSLITHKNLHAHVKDYGSAILSAMREDPDVIFVGELRDPASIQAAITASETGHLVLSTLHTANAVQTIDRIINSFPPIQQYLIRGTLAETLKCVISQALLPRIDTKGMIPALEIVIGCTQVANIIRDEKTYQLPSIIQTSKNMGMKTMDQSLLELLKEKKAAISDAYEYAQEKEAFKEYLK